MEKIYGELTYLEALDIYKHLMKGYYKYLDRYFTTHRKSNLKHAFHMVDVATLVDEQYLGGRYKPKFETNIV